jgi:hypothetical protein
MEMVLTAAQKKTGPTFYAKMPSKSLDYPFSTDFTALTRFLKSLYE